MSSSRLDGKLSYLLRALGFVLLYFATARFGLGIGSVAGVATPVWPPTGLALAALLLFGVRMWPAVALAAFLTNFSVGVPPSGALVITVGNTLEAVTAAWLLRRFDFSPSLRRLRDVLLLVVLGAIVSTTVSASIGTAAMKLTRLPAALDIAWRVWWSGDAMGDLLVAPLLLVWASPPEPRWRLLHGHPLRMLEAAALLLTQTAVGLTFFVPAVGSLAICLLFPGLIWAAVRFGQHGVVSTTFLTAILAVWATASGHGPFIGASTTDSLIALHAFVGVVTITFLALGASIEERDAELRCDLVHAVRARDDFLSVASHELKTPLTALTLKLGLACKDGGSDSDERATLLCDSQRLLRRLARMIDELLDVTRIRAGHLMLEPEQVDLCEIVGDVVYRYGEEVARSGCRLEVATGSPVVGRWDRARLDQVVSNLLSNALKYGKGGQVRVSVETEGRRARLTVQDHGIGIGAEHQARIFERFERAAPSRSYGGLGLGLWIVHEIVGASAGRIRVESTLGVGSTFTVELPSSDDAVAPDRVSPRPGWRNGSRFRADGQRPRSADGGPGRRQG